MPQALGLLTLIPNIGTLLGAGGLFGFLSGGLGSTLLTVGLSFGLNYLGSLLLKPKTPKPEDVQNIIRSSISPRVRHSGRGKVGGTAAFRDSKDGTFYEVIATGHGELAEIEEIWVDDTAVDIDGTGLVTAPENLAGKLRIQYRMGLPTETSYADLTAVIPEWTADHRGDGARILLRWRNFRTRAECPKPAALAAPAGRHGRPDRALRPAYGCGSIDIANRGQRLNRRRGPRSLFPMACRFGAL